MGRQVTQRAFSSTLHEAVIVSACRTPIGSFGGCLSTVKAPKLAAAAVSAAVERAGIDPSAVGEVFLGNVCSAGLGQAPARQAALFAGLPNTVPCTTVNKVCASGLKSVMFAAQSVMLGQQDCVVAGGFESMSNIPYYIEKAREGYRYGHGEIVDGLLKDGLWDVYDNHHMGMCAEKCATDYTITREQQDAYALESYRRAADATENGRFKNEICPVTVPNRKGDIVVSEDEEFKRISVSKVPGLRPAFKKDGSVTAANASTLNDGASALIIMSAAKAKAEGLTPLARIRGFGDAAGAPVDFTTAPSLAVPVALQNAGMSLSDLEYHEVNEAFSVVALANAQILGMDLDRVNVNGGAVALGHPIGSSGGRILTTLINVLQQKDASVGCASICNGGGGAAALIIERI